MVRVDDVSLLAVGVASGLVGTAEKETASERPEDLLIWDAVAITITAILPVGTTSSVKGLVASQPIGLHDIGATDAAMSVLTEGLAVFIS